MSRQKSYSEISLIDKQEGFCLCIDTTCKSEWCYQCIYQVQTIEPNHIRGLINRSLVYLLRAEITLVRGGTLLASMMASLPAWRAIDPLPVLGAMEDNGDDDTETLQSMVESEDKEAEDSADKR